MQIFDKNVPLPPKGTFTPPAIHYEYERMEIGDSFRRAHPRHISSVYNKAHRLGITLAVRPEGDGIRVWRLA